MPYTRKREVLKVWCPYCGAGVGEMCATEHVDAAGNVERQEWPREWSMHRERHAHAIALGAPELQRRRRGPRGEASKAQ